jgi:hypothetical protein
LLFEYSYSTGLLGKDAIVRPSVVLVDVKTQKKYVIPSRREIRGWSTGGGSDGVELPPDLPKGRYRVFYYIHDEATLISTGHYFVADL